MTGLELLNFLLPLVGEATKLASQALALGRDYDPTLEKQVRALVDVANARMTSADLAIEAEDRATDDRLTGK